MTPKELRDWIKSRDLTQAAAAKALSISHSTLDAYLAGRRSDRVKPVSIPPRIEDACRQISEKGYAEPPFQRVGEPEWMQDARTLIAAGRSKIYVSGLLRVPKSVFYREWDKHNE